MNISFVRLLQEYSYSNKGNVAIIITGVSINVFFSKILQNKSPQEEGRLIDHVWKENRYKDLVCYGIVNSIGL